MAGYIGSKASVVSSGAERKKTFAITTTTTALTGLVYTPTKVHVFHNGVRLVDGTDFTATNSTSITLTVAAESGDQVVVVSYASFQTSDTVSASAGGTFAGDVVFGANATFGDNDKAIFGAGSDLQIKHTGTHAYMSNTTGNTYLQGGGQFRVQSASGENHFIANADGAVNLYHDNAEKLATTSTGIDVTGIAVADGLTVARENLTDLKTWANDDVGSIDFYQAQNHPNANSYKRLLDINAGGENAGSIIRFLTQAGGSASAEAMRIDSSGNLLVGKTSSDSGGTAGLEYHESYGVLYLTDANGECAIFNRLSSDGDIIRFRKDGATVGSIGNSGNYMFLASQGPSARGVKITDNFIPATTSGANNDNSMDLGGASVRWNDVYATNGSIQTSDRNEKQDVAALTATEMLVAARISGLFKTFRWIDSVADKGDNARTHTGVIAQDVQAAFIAEGLDAGDYALFTSATWWETQTEVPAVDVVEAADATYDDDGNELTAAVEAVEAADAYTRTDTFDTLDEAPDGASERTRMGIRYPELLAFVGSYNEQRFASIETRLAALEGN